MPTASRLVSAAVLCLLAMLVSEMVKPEMPDGTDFGYFTVVNGAFGLLVGWTIMGPRAGRGIVAAINNGITGTAALVFVVIFAHSANEMMRLALRRRFDGPVEAIVSIFEIGLEYAVTAFTIPSLLVLAIGGILAGLMAENAFRYWR